jgi:hypothetical protein
MSGPRIAGWLVVTLVILGAFFGGRASVADLEMRRDTLIVERKLAADTVIKYLRIADTSKARSDRSKAKSDSADAKLSIESDTTVRVHETPEKPARVAVVPAEVTRDLLTLRQTAKDQATTIFDQRAAMSRQAHSLSLDSLQFQVDAQIIGRLKRNQCSLECKIALVGTGFVIAKLTSRRD